MGKTAPPLPLASKNTVQVHTGRVNAGVRRQFVGAKIINNGDYLPEPGLGSSRASTKTRTSPFAVSYRFAPSHSDPAVRFSMWMARIPPLFRRVERGYLVGG